jgi:hypothetical protein
MSLRKLRLVVELEVGDTTSDEEATDALRAWLDSGGWSGRAWWGAKVELETNDES